MSGLLAWISARNKFFMALAAGEYSIGLFVVNSTPKAITANEWMLFVGAGLAAAGVHQIPNVFASQPTQVPMTVVPSMTYTTTAPSNASTATPPQVTGGTTPEIPPAA